MTELVPDIEVLVLATPGVLALYRTGSVVTNLISAAVEQWGTSEDAASRVVVTRRGDVAEVDIAIGIESAAGAVETAQAVHERVQALLLSRGEQGAFVRITVAHVADGRPLA
ncbi:hypothetical protein [Microbacterium sp. A84]|uniref:hypothetical protein n=1 Tax=Microbacterium sp. A84 TaxID=3450715 RepID=UPI003F43372A